MSKSLRSIAVRSMVVALGGASVFVVAPATAKPRPTPTGSFTCKATLVRTERSNQPLLNQQLFVANAGGGACANDSAGLTGSDKVTIAGVGTVDVLYARTFGNSHTAESGVARADLTVAGIPVSVALLTSTASGGTCAPPGPALSGSSEVLEVKVGGQTVEVPPGSKADDTPDHVVPGVMDIHLNYQTETTGNDRVRTQRALFIDVKQGSLGLAAVPDVIIAESVADIHGDPCSTPVSDTGRCPPASPEGRDTTPDKDCGWGQPSDVTKNPKG